MFSFNKEEIKKELTSDQVFEFLEEYHGEPEFMNDNIIISRTICHNKADVDASRKLYYYCDSQLFHCYTGCENPSFDIFELMIKIADLQLNQQFDLNQAVRFIAYKFGILNLTNDTVDKEGLEDWQYLNNYERIQNITLKVNKVELKEYDSSILNVMNYNVCIRPWLNDGISQEVMKKARIGYYAGGEQISIPHYDESGKLIGLRGRSLVKEDIDQYGKYRPIYLNSVIYKHPLGLNLYNLNNSKDGIKKIGKAIIFESEKSCLQYQTYFGVENDITVACCGSNITAYQIELLKRAGAKEIIVAFDRQFQQVGDPEYIKLTKKLESINSKYKNEVMISFIFDKKRITSYKASPTDEGPEKFIKLFKERIVL